MAEDRLCVVCGESFSSEKYDRGDAPCGVDENGLAACTLDMTGKEAWSYWRQKYHQLWEENQRLKERLGDVKVRKSS